MGKKVREAGMDWVPYVIVVGDEEVAIKKTDRDGPEEVAAQQAVQGADDYRGSDCCCPEGC